MFKMCRHCKSHDENVYEWVKSHDENVYIWAKSRDENVYNPRGKAGRENMAYEGIWADLLSAQRIYFYG